MKGEAVEQAGIETFKCRLKDETLEKVIPELFNFVFDEMEDERIPYESDIFDLHSNEGETYQLSAATYVLLLANLIQIFHNDSNGVDKLDLNLKIYFTYQPPNLFDRINLQKGLFVFNLISIFAITNIIIMY